MNWLCWLFWWWESSNLCQTQQDFFFSKNKSIKPEQWMDEWMKKLLIIYRSSSISQSMVNFKKRKHLNKSKSDSNENQHGMIFSHIIIIIWFTANGKKIFFCHCGWHLHWSVELSLSSSSSWAECMCGCVRSSSTSIDWLQWIFFYVNINQIHTDITKPCEIIMIIIVVLLRVQLHQLNIYRQSMISFKKIILFDSFSNVLIDII